MRAAVTAMAPLPVVVPPVVEAAHSEEMPPRRAASHYLWAMLLARIYETLPLVCPLCQSPMRIIAFIAEGSSVHKILECLGESTLPPKVALRVDRRCGNWKQRIGWRAMILNGIQPLSLNRCLGLISGWRGET